MDKKKYIGAYTRSKTGVKRSMHLAMRNKLINVVASSDYAHGRKRKMERE